MPPIVNERDHDEKISRDFKLKGVSDGKIILENLEAGPLVIHVSGQETINQLLDVDANNAEIYSKMNRITERFGDLILEENWKEAFQLAKRKTDYERRANLLRDIMGFFEENHGNITRIKVAGTVPFPDYMAMTLLQFISDKGETNGLPIIWEDKNEILGFRPLFTKYPLSFLATREEDDFVLYYPQTQIIQKLGNSQ